MEVEGRVLREDPFFPPLSPESVPSDTLSDGQKKDIFHLLDSITFQTLWVDTHKPYLFDWVSPEVVGNNLRFDDLQLFGAYQAILLWQHVFAYRNATETAPDPRMTMTWSSVPRGGTLLSDAVRRVEQWARATHAELRRRSDQPILDEEFDGSYTRITTPMAELVVSGYRSSGWRIPDIPLPEVAEVDEFFQRFFGMVDTRIDEYVDLMRIEYGTLLLLQSGEGRDIETARSAAETNLRADGTILVAKQRSAGLKRRRIGAQDVFDIL